MDWHRWFIPHKDTHQKAHLISGEALAVYILLFILLQISFSILGYAKPGILGISSNIQQSRIIELTNAQRAKAGLPTLAENSSLSQAAAAKAANMFEENYWAHFSPSGRDPWGFLLGAGYKFQFAGENLAKDFSNSEDLVSAWMASSTHRDNILNPKYQEIGTAVVDGILNGQQTTLVVQMFGTTSTLAHLPQRQPTQLTAQPTTQPTTQPIINIGGQKYLVSKGDYEKPRSVISLPASPPMKPKLKPLVDPFQVLRVTGLATIGLIATLLLVDILVLRRRGVFRIHSHHLAHLSILTVAATAILSTRGGSIL